MEINFILSHMTEISFTNVFVFEHWGLDWRSRSYAWENTRGVVCFKRVLQIHKLERLPRKRYQVHQQRTPDLCGPTFQLITEYTPILDTGDRKVYYKTTTNRGITDQPHRTKPGKHGYTHAHTQKVQNKTSVYKQGPRNTCYARPPPIPYKGCSRGPKLGTYSDWGLSSVLVINKHLSHHYARPGEYYISGVHGKSTLTRYTHV